MSDKRFTFYYERGNEVVFKDNGQRISNKQLVDLLNEQQATIETQELRLQQLEELLELSENLNKSYRDKLIDMNKMMIDNE